MTRDHRPRQISRPRGGRINPAEYAAGYKAGVGDTRHPSRGGTGGGIPPGRKGCPLLLAAFAAIPAGLALAGWAVGAAWGAWS